MAEIHDVRQSRLKEILRANFNNTQRDLAEALDRDANYISRVLSTGPNRKNIGEDFAREIESLLSLPKGYLDDNSVTGTKETPAVYATGRAVKVHDMRVSPEALMFAQEWEKLREPLRAQIETLVLQLVGEQKRGDRNPPGGGGGGRKRISESRTRPSRPDA